MEVMQSCIDVIELEKYAIIGIIDTKKLESNDLAKYPVIVTQIYQIY